MVHQVGSRGVHLSPETRGAKSSTLAGERYEAALGGLVIAFAEACERADRPSDAYEMLERSLARRPEDGALALQLEHTCEAMGAWARLSELLLARAKRTKNAGQMAKLLLHAARLLADDLNRPAEALAPLERACAVCPDDLEATLARARVLLALHRPDKALAILDPAIDQAGARRGPLIAALHLESAKACLARGTMGEAFDKLRSGFARFPRHRELAMLLGHVALDAGDAKTAERAFLEAVGSPRTTTTG